MLDNALDNIGYAGADLCDSAYRSVTSAPVSDTDPVAQERYDSAPTATNVQIYRRYSRGFQPLMLTDQQESMLEGLPLHSFADNVYDQILNINKDRLKVTDFTVTAPEGMSEEAGKLVADTVIAFIRNFRIKTHFDAEQNKIHKAVLRDGDHYDGLAWDEDGQRVLLIQEPSWDGDCGMYMAYGENGLPLYAVKEWVCKESVSGNFGSTKNGILSRFFDYIKNGTTVAAPTKTYRYRTIYRPYQIERYRQEQGGNGQWEIYQRSTTDGDGSQVNEPWPIPWVKRDGSPLGIPVIHFSVGGDSYYGQPVAPLPVVANQDFLNDLRCDLAAVGRQTGFQRAVLAGFPAQKQDPSAPENPNKLIDVEYPTGPGMMYITENPQGSGMILPPGDPAGLINIYNLTLESMSRQTQTPFFLLTIGSNSSGAAILRAEAPLAGKAQEQTESLGPSYATLMHRAIEIYNARNRAGITINEDAMITPVWADTSKPDAMAVVEFDQAKASLTRAQMVLEQEQKAIDEGRPIYLPPDDNARRLATVTVPADAQQIAAL